MNITSQQWIYIGSGVASAVAAGVLGYNIYLSRTAPVPAEKPAPAVTADAPKPASAPDTAGAPASGKPPKPQEVQKSAAAAPPAPSAAAGTADRKSRTQQPAAQPGGTLGNVAKALSPKKPSEDPEFDLVRVEPSGDTVVAGRAKPGEEVSLLNKGKPVGKAKANSAGEFVIIPDRLTPGAHRLTLKAGSNGKDRVSKQNVAVAVPEKGKKEVVVALAEPDKPTVILSDPKPAPAATALAKQPTPAAPDSADKPATQNGGSPPTAGGQAPPKAGGGPAETRHAALPASSGADSPPAAPAPRVLFRTVEAQQGGGFFATGTAAPGARIRIYLNNAFLADVQASKDGRWSLRVGKGLTPGKYVVRADVVDPGSGKVVARAEVPFEYSSAVAAGPRTAQPDNPAAAAAQPGPETDGQPASGKAASPQAVAARTAPARTAMAAPSRPADAANPASASPAVSGQGGTTAAPVRNTADSPATGNGATPAPKRTAVAAARPANQPASAEPDSCTATPASAASGAANPATKSGSQPVTSQPESLRPAKMAAPAAAAAPSANAAPAGDLASAGNSDDKPAPQSPANPGAKVGAKVGPKPAGSADVRLPPPPPAHVVIEKLSTRSVVKGDSLWRISRQIYGRGIRYTQIYAANTDQIRNPHLIYPGQVLVVPVGKPEPVAGTEKTPKKPEPAR